MTEAIRKAIDSDRAWVVEVVRQRDEALSKLETVNEERKGKTDG